MSYFPHHSHSKNKIEAELDLISHNLTKKKDLGDLKSEVDKLDIHKLQKVWSGWSNLKSKVNKLNVDKLVPVPDDLNKLSDVADNFVVKKTVLMILVDMLQHKD